MNCLLCHQKIPRLRAWRTKSEFCSDEHAEQYKTQMMERLLTAQASEAVVQPPAAPLPIAPDPIEEPVETEHPAEVAGQAESFELQQPEFSEDERFNMLMEAVSEGPPPDMLAPLPDAGGDAPGYAGSLGGGIFGAGYRQDPPSDSVAGQSAEDALAALRALAQRAPKADRPVPELEIRDEASEQPSVFESDEPVPTADSGSISYDDVLLAEIDRELTSPRGHGSSSISDFDLDDLAALNEAEPLPSAVPPKKAGLREDGGAETYGELEPPDLANVPGMAHLADDVDEERVRARSYPDESDLEDDELIILSTASSDHGAGAAELEDTVELEEETAPVEAAAEFEELDDLQLEEAPFENSEEAEELMRELLDAVDDSPAPPVKLPQEGARGPAKVVQFPLPTGASEPAEPVAEPTAEHLEAETASLDALFARPTARDSKKQLPLQPSETMFQAEPEIAQPHASDRFPDSTWNDLSTANLTPRAPAFEPHTESHRHAPPTLGRLTAVNRIDSGSTLDLFLNVLSAVLPEGEQESAAYAAQEGAAPEWPVRWPAALVDLVSEQEPEYPEIPAAPESEAVEEPAASRPAEPERALAPVEEIDLTALQPDEPQGGFWDGDDEEFDEDIEAPRLRAEGGG